MLKNVKVIPTLPATDIKRAKKFYEEKLGLKTVESNDEVLVMSTGEGTEGSVFESGEGNVFTIYQREQPTTADHTVLTFEVHKLESEIKELEKRGVKFEDYDRPDLKTKNHIAEMGNDRAAWFKDSEGNILAIHESLN